MILEALPPLVFVGLLIDASRYTAWFSFGFYDSSLYSGIAALWQKGLLPYRDLYEIKPPGIFIALRIAFSLWGHQAEGLHRIFLLCDGIGVLVLYTGLRVAGFTIAAPVAGLGFLTLMLIQPWSVLLQNTETLVAAFTTASVGSAMAVMTTGRRGWAALSGVCLGLACLGKQPAFFYVAPLLLQVALGPRGRFRNALVFMAAFIAVFIPVFGYFALYGALGPFYEVVFRDPGRFAGMGHSFWAFGSHLFTAGWWHNVGIPAMQFVLTNLTPFGLAAMALPLATCIRPSRLAVVAWAWLGTMWLPISIGLAPIVSHHLVMGYPVLALLAGVSCELAAGTGSRRQLVGGLVLGGLLFGNLLRTDYLPYRLQRPANCEPGTLDLEDMGKHIQDAARPGDTLLLESEGFAIYMYAGVPPPTRFIYEDAPNPAGNAERARALAGLPTFIVARGELDNYMQQGTPATAAPVHYQQWLNTLRQHYERWVVSRYVNGAVYRRVDRPSPAVIAPEMPTAPRAPAPSAPSAD